MQKSTYRTATHVLSGFLAGIFLTLLFAFRNEGEKQAAAIMLDKNNVLYIGVDNPARVVVQGVAPEDVTLQSDELAFQKTGDYTYNIRAVKPGLAKISLSGKGYVRTYQYRVKAIPFPVAMLGARHISKSIRAGEFRAQGGIDAVIEHFDFDARCDVISYTVTYQPKQQDYMMVTNTGKRFGPEARALIYKAQPGDTYYFDEIKCKCPGDDIGRDLGSLTFQIR